MKLPLGAIVKRIKGNLVVLFGGNPEPYREFGNVYEEVFTTYPPRRAGWGLVVDEEEYVVVGDSIVPRLDRLSGS